MKGSCFKLELKNDLVVVCENCGFKLEVLKDSFTEDTYSCVRNMGAEIEYVFQSDCMCEKCENSIQITIRGYEYPVGTLEYKEHKCEGGNFVELSEFIFEYDYLNLAEDEISFNVNQICNGLGRSLIEMPKDYCQEIADIIEKYRIHDKELGILNIDVNKKHVEKWISQFDNHQNIILQETTNFLNEYYFSIEDIEGYLTEIYSSQEIWGEDIRQAIADTVFLNCQTKGNSQNLLHKKSRKIIKNLYGIDIHDNKPDSMAYVYVDDCMFSGNTVRKDMEKLIKKIPNGSKVNVIFIMVHSFGEWWAKKSLEEQIKQKNIDFHIWRFKEIQNSGGKNFEYDCLWPQEYESAMLGNYLKDIENESKNSPEKKIRLFRENSYTGGIYTSEKNRSVFEQELMTAGLKIIGFSENQKTFIRPMGYDNRISFGFGAFFATYLNISNNCPIAFWWGDANAKPWHPLSKWYPLLPRSVNESNGEIFA